MIISRAPVRLSLGGGGTDLPSYYEKRGGFLIAAALNKYVFVMANRRFEDSIRLSYSTTEIIKTVGEIRHNIFREALRIHGIERGIELVSIADVPAQCGLGSSSTFTVALLNALFAYRRNYCSLEDLAQAAVAIELNVLRQPIGKQDQYASAYGGLNAYWFERDGSVKIEPIAISVEGILELQHNISLFYLFKEREAKDILASQNKRSSEGDEETLERLDRIKQIGLNTKRIFEKGRFDEFGEILHEHWCVKKSLSAGISDAAIDEAYDLGRKSGALGGKVVGAGGGGFLMFYCPGHKTKLAENMGKIGLRPMHFAFEREGARIVFQD